MTPHYRGVQVSPHGLPHSDTRGLTGCVLLPAAFRSLPRPSSPRGPKASTPNLSSLGRAVFVRSFTSSTTVYVKDPQNIGD